MEIFLLICTSVLFFFLPKKHLVYFNLVLFTAFTVLISKFAINALFFDVPYSYTFSLWQKSVELSLDKISAVFALVICFTMMTAAVYSIGYFSMYKEKSKTETSIYFFSYFTLFWSMILAIMLQHTLAFLFAWEIMSLSSFILVMFEAEKAKTLKAGINYLIQMHVGALFLLIAIILLHNDTGMWDWNSLSAYFAHNPNLGLFLLFFIGFGTKAGFLPFHTWLPHAHPAAPTPVSAVMSGVMLKLGIFGILKVVFFLQNDLMAIGMTVLTVSLISGISGIGVAIIQKNLKKLLAYSSIENIGIMGIGIGIGIIGMQMQNQLLTMLGFAGTLLHVINHSLYKSLLFFGAGSVYHQTHSMNIDSMGGLIKKMPITALFFLIGAISICGLPPFNGFISEFLIYNGFIEGLQTGTIFVKVVMLFSILGLTAIGGLAIFCFTKVFGTVFLGNPRSDCVSHAHEMKWHTLLPQGIIVLIILCIGLFPEIMVKPIFAIIGKQFSFSILEIPNTNFLKMAGITSAIFIAVIAVMWVIRTLVFRKKISDETVTWGCGYSGEAPKTQYTGTSYAENFSHNMDNSLNVTTKYTPIEDNDVFPAPRTFTSKSESLIEERLLFRPMRHLAVVMRKLAFVQTGQMQHYILYAFVLLIVLLLLTVFNII